MFLKKSVKVFEKQISFYYCKEQTFHWLKWLSNLPKQILSWLILLAINLNRWIQRKISALLNNNFCKWDKKLLINNTTSICKVNLTLGIKICLWRILQWELKVLVWLILIADRQEVMLAQLININQTHVIADFLL